jgi:hypothetical protein
LRCKAKLPIAPTASSEAAGISLTLDHRRYGGRRFFELHARKRKMTEDIFEGAEKARLSKDDLLITVVNHIPMGMYHVAKQLLLV